MIRLNAATVLLQWAVGGLFLCWVTTRRREVGILGRPFAAERSVTAQTFRLHATPIVNLFSQMAEPIRVTHLSHEYRVIPNLRRPGAHEVRSVDSFLGER